MQRGKTISIHLLNGNPNGVKILELSNRIVRAFEIPRILLSEVKDREDINRAALYFLWDKTSNKVYVGESDHFYDRVKNHDQNKDFWDTAVVFVAKDDSLDKGDVRYLESLAMSTAKSAERSEIVNSASRTANNLHEFKRQAIEEFFEDTSLLLSALGYKIFEQTKPSADKEIWHCKTRKTDARGIYDKNSFVVLKGSIIDATIRPSFKAFPEAIRLRESIFEQISEKISPDTYRLKNDMFFSSLNQASGFCVGGTVNGWTAWKNRDGRTIDEVIRKTL